MLEQFGREDEIEASFPFREGLKVFGEECLAREVLLRESNTVRTEINTGSAARESG